MTLETIFRSSLPPSKFRIVAITLWPLRASVTAVANPMPLLVPVTNAMATFASLGLYGDVLDVDVKDSKPGADVPTVVRCRSREAPNGDR